MTVGRRFLRKSMCSMYCEKESAAISSEILGINNSFVFDRQWRLVGKIVTGTDEKLNLIY